MDADVGAMERGGKTRSGRRGGTEFGIGGTVVTEFWTVSTDMGCVGGSAVGYHGGIRRMVEWR